MIEYLILAYMIVTAIIGGYVFVSVYAECVMEKGLVIGGSLRLLPSSCLAVGFMVIWPFVLFWVATKALMG